MVAVKGPCGTKSRTLCPAVLASLGPPLMIFFERWALDSSAIRCGSSAYAYGWTRACPHREDIERVKFVITLITAESCIFHERPPAVD